MIQSRKLGELNVNLPSFFQGRCTHMHGQVWEEGEYAQMGMISLGVLIHPTPYCLVFERSHSESRQWMLYSIVKESENLCIRES